MDDTNVREAATKRAEQIAAIHDFADWLHANPGMPVPQLNLFRHLHHVDGTDAECLDTVRSLAASIGADADEHLDDRTVLRCRVNGHVWYELFAWHKAGRGAIDEVDRLRARVAELEARDDGQGFSREADDPTPVSAGRGVHAATVLSGIAEDGHQLGKPGKPHEVTDEGLVDETPERSAEIVDQNLRAMGSAGLVDETPAEPVTWHFSFGHGQTDPDTGKDLLGHYVTVIAPTPQACREAMIASRYGQEWAFDYDPASPQWLEWGPRWTEHEVIDAMPNAAAFTAAAVTESCVFAGDHGGWCKTHQAVHKPSGKAECGCSVYPFAGRGDAADTIVDHRRDCPGHPYASTD